jgi:hypothetical protein
MRKLRHQADDSGAGSVHHHAAMTWRRSLWHGALLGAVVAAIGLQVPAGADDPTVLVVPRAGAAGGPAMYLPNGDLLNVRNIQGGTMSSDPSSLNLDLGAGDTEHPGDVAINYDVGRDVIIYDGHKRAVARIGSSGVIFYKSPLRPNGKAWVSARRR